MEVLPEVAPHADFIHSPLLPDVIDTVVFTDSSVDLDGSIVSWFWNLGDGNTSILQNPTHSYSSAGLYPVSLSITDNDGDGDSVSKLVIVGIEINHVQNTSSGWNFISPPFNGTINKNELFVKYDGYFYSWSMATTGANPTDYPIIDTNLFSWDRLLQFYTTETYMYPGYGNWIFSYQSVELWKQVEILPPPDEYITSVQYGWNMIGTAHDELVNKTDILVNGLSWVDAVSSGLIDNNVFGWLRLSQSYILSGALISGESYWVLAYQPCVLRRTS